MRPSEKEMFKKLIELRINSEYHRASIDLANWAMDQMEIKTNQEGVMSFEKWWDDPYRPNYEVSKEVARTFFNMGKLYSAANAIQIPDVSKWPNWCVGIRAYYLGNSIGEPDGRSIVFEIPRPKPQWTPEVGEAAFWLSDDRIKIVKIGQSDGLDYGITTIEGFKYGVELKYLKPFDPAKIGLSWEKI